MSTVQVFSVDDMAKLLSCSAKTVEELARRGELPGLKPGGGWIFPAGALAQRLDELALQQAAERRKPAAPMAVAAAPRGGKKKKARLLPRLVDVGPRS